MDLFETLQTPSVPDDPIPPQGRPAASRSAPKSDDSLQALIGWMQTRRPLVLTGAGCSTESGIPDYRDESGNWKSRQPMTYRSFVSARSSRQRYWSRSFHGWKRIEGASPNAAHQALAGLEAAGRIHHLVTQNVDSLHQRAGSRKVTDLHGRLDTVHCIRCAYRTERERFQLQLEEANPDWQARVMVQAPDGDVELDRSSESFQIPDCPACGGILKPAVVFFGEGVPSERVEQTKRLLEESDSLLVVGSSLMVWSGFRFARLAADRGLSLAAINLGVTRADDLLDVKVRLSCSGVLPQLLKALD